MTVEILTKHEDDEKRQAEAILVLLRSRHSTRAAEPEPAPGERLQSIVRSAETGGSTRYPNDAGSSTFLVFRPNEVKLLLARPRAVA